MRPLSRDALRTLDRRAAEEFGLPTLVLMENAGRGAAEWLLPRVLEGGRVLVACGGGNNGGDGGVVARHLDIHNVPVTVVWFAEPGRLSTDAAVQHAILARSGIDQHDRPGALDRDEFRALLEQAAWIVDGLLGTGLTRPVEGLLRDVIEAINAAGKPVLALDLPSGLDADTGRPLGVAVRAAATVTFAAPKLGFAVPGADAYTGPVHVAHIGAPRRLLEDVGP
jgi:NAD(P)H-hydrate epimerase